MAGAVGLGAGIVVAPYIAPYIAEWLTYSAFSATAAVTGYQAASNSGAH